MERLVNLLIISSHIELVAFLEMIDDSVVICVTDCEWYILLILRALTTICKTSSFAPSDAQVSLRYPRIYDQYTFFVTSNPTLWPHQAAGLHNIFELISEIDAVF